MQGRPGKVAIPSDSNIQPHEISAAKILARRGADVAFIPRREGKGVKTPDMQIGGMPWELKSPVSDKLTAIERNLRRASKQSRNVVLDVRRMKGHSDAQLGREARACLGRVKSLHRLMLIKKSEEVVDIK